MLWIGVVFVDLDMVKIMGSVWFTESIEINIRFGEIGCLFDLKLIIIVLLI